MVAVNLLERADAAVGYLQHVAIDCGIIQSVALVRGEGDGDVLVLGGKNMACNLDAAEGGGAVIDRNVDLVHGRLGLSGLAFDGEGDGRSAAADVLPAAFGVDVQQLAGLALGGESVGAIYITFRGYFDRASPLFSIPSSIEGVAAFNNINSLVVFVVGYAVDNNAHIVDVRIGRRLRIGLRIRLGLIDLIIADLNLDYFVADLLKF